MSPTLRPVSTNLTARVQTVPGRPTHRLLAGLRRLWRGGLLRRWQELRAPIMLAIGVGSLVLGTIGYLELTSVKPRYGFFDALYRAITLFAFGGAAPPPIPVALQIARIAAPLLTGYAAIGAVIALTREQARVIGIRLFVRHHVVIAGLGATGRRLAAALVDHVPVVVIEADRNSEHLTGARLRGVRVLNGSAADPKLLEQAGLEHAQTLVVSCGSGDTNVDVAAAAVNSLPSRGSPLNVFVHLDNVDLWSSLAAEGATFRSPRPDVRLEYFNVWATGAQMLIEHDPPLMTDGEHHVLLVGLEAFGEQLVLQLARLWAERAPSPEAKLRVTLTGATAERDLAGLLARYPALAHYFELSTRPLVIESADFQAGAAMSEPGAPCDVTRVYVSLADEAAALLAALALHSRPDAMGVPVTVAVEDDAAGVSSVLGSERGRFANVEPFGMLSQATRSHLLLRGTNEMVARAQHAQWLRSQQARGVKPGENPHMRPWEDLTEDQREVNRRFADSVHEKLALVHCMLVPDPLPPREQSLFAFTEPEVELLAQQEHVRWMQVRQEAGWTYGVPRNDTRKIHDQLKPWEELDEPNRDKDRDAVREIPKILASAGFAIRRQSEQERADAEADATGSAPVPSAPPQPRPVIDG